MMKRVKAIVSYDGTNFSGYQVQPNKRTVQGELQRALAVLHKAGEWHATGSGRTDAGVHSLGQTIHFDTPLSIPEERWHLALNSLLPEDIVVRSAAFVDGSFHARFDAVGKMYVYRLWTGSEKNVFTRNYVGHIPGTLSYNNMLAAARHLTGTHDFTSFSSPKTSVEDKVRKIYSIHIDQQQDEWEFQFIGSGFLYQMVRILTGTLVHVGTGALSPADIPVILAGKNRSLAGPTAPGNGLYLTKVFYHPDDLHRETAAVKKKFK
ncbi:tRNA pseudouridine38-40 synthase [Evansella caseinilytica]|uniref:tRNA pseudouridine synthase A n=1 Tax=Evansella caseinilytica TaxID=1503961 RepID=A0A1H3UKF9_9BACI|nr:tRNA pseudouridine(38-40) synthase TruA [Evansella caseinilytica]SDZ62796.1 tRNA pseudouridine38-40 synthase [Evansella caseinilytica]